MLKALISLGTLTGICISNRSGPMMQALEHLTEMAAVADRKYESETQKILKSLRRDVARRRREMKSIPATSNDV